MKKKTRILLIILAVLLLILVIGSLAAKSFMAKAEENLKEFSRMEITNPDLSQIADGIYSGTLTLFPLDVKVSVTVTGHRITGVDLIKHTNGKGGGAEILTQKVVETQRVNLDTVTGATYSSKAILKAVENALLSGKKD